MSTAADEQQIGVIGGFKEAMASFPSGVTVVTTVDAEGMWWGFTATSFCSLSLDPPLVLVCLSTDAQCHPVFSNARTWVVHLLPDHHQELAIRFATRGIDKFATEKFSVNEHGDPVLAEACTTLDCRTYARHGAGDHTILVGEVTATRLCEDRPAVYYRRGFRTLTP